MEHTCVYFPLFHQLLLFCYNLHVPCIWTDEWNCIPKISGAEQSAAVISPMSALTYSLFSLSVSCCVWHNPLNLLKARTVGLRKAHTNTSESSNYSEERCIHMKKSQQEVLEFIASLVQAVTIRYLKYRVLWGCCRNGVILHTNPIVTENRNMELASSK